ncbi:uncharacterized protein LOC115768972 [Drosophila novamexicana]|uniref:uncharacterized protein LOC115768972 n=1 Tax=Drosophila novamexicana TaxID=47314 RepID=UPI0011E5CD8D|nr:uncharacterized protein LOC115768972 [Drosophila novamexicana]
MPMPSLTANCVFNQEAIVGRIIFLFDQELFVWAMPEQSPTPSWVFNQQAVVEHVIFWTAHFRRDLEASSVVSHTPRSLARNCLTGRYRSNRSPQIEYWAQSTVIGASSLFAGQHLVSWFGNIRWRLSLFNLNHLPARKILTVSLFLI